MVIKFYKKIKEEIDMSQILENISGKSAEEILRDFGGENKIVTDIFSIAKGLGIDIRTADFSEIEEEVGIQKGKILGCVIDDDEKNSLQILLQDRLAEVPYLEIMKDDEKRNILRKRHRFTIAHEIAHAALHLQGQDIRFRLDEHKNFEISEKNAENDYERSEYAANVFAGELLIPRNSLIEVLKRLYKPTIDSLANIFDVSRSVMEERLRYLQLMDIISG